MYAMFCFYPESPEESQISMEYQRTQICRENSESSIFWRSIDDYQT